MNLLINISQIAIITGDNPYKTKKDFLIEYWEKYNKKDYDECSKESKFIKLDDNDIIQNISKKNKIDINDDIKKCMKTKNTEELNNLKRKMNDKIKDLSNYEKKEITKSLNNITNTNFGTRNETDVTKIYELITNSIIIKDDKYKIKSIIKNDTFSIRIGGKIDGINKDNNCIIEVKNRVNRLFYSLKDYEKVQIMCYIYLFEEKKGHLVEALKKKESCTINIIEVLYDEKYMNYIIEKLNNFGIYFYKFMNDKNLRLNILNMKNIEDIRFE
jgi:hypothetical protein